MVALKKQEAHMSESNEKELADFETAAVTKMEERIPPCRKKYLPI